MSETTLSTSAPQGVFGPVPKGLLYDGKQVTQIDWERFLVSGTVATGKTIGQLCTEYQAWYDSDKADRARRIDEESSRREEELIAYVATTSLNATERNKSAGQKALDLCRFRAVHLDGFDGKSFESACSNVAIEASKRARISPDAIRVGDWARAVAFLECVPSLGTEYAQVFSFAEAIELGRSTAALKFDAKSVRGEIKEDWADFVIELAIARADESAYIPFSQIKERIKAHKKSLAGGVADSDSAEKERLAKRKKARKALTDTVSESVALFSPDEIAHMFAALLESQGIAMPESEFVRANSESEPADGDKTVTIDITPALDPATATVEQLEQFATAMFAAARFAELEALGRKCAALCKAGRRAIESKGQKKSA